MACVGTEQPKVTPKRLAQQKFPIEMISAVLDKDTEGFTEYRRLRKIQNSANYIVKQVKSQNF